VIRNIQRNKGNFLNLSYYFMDSNPEELTDDEINPIKE